MKLTDILPAALLVTGASADCYRVHITEKWLGDDTVKWAPIFYKNDAEARPLGSMVGHRDEEGFVTAKLGYAVAVEPDTPGVKLELSIDGQQSSALTGMIYRENELGNPDGQTAFLYAVDEGTKVTGEGQISRYCLANDGDGCADKYDCAIQQDSYVDDPYETPAPIAPRDVEQPWP